MLVVTYLLEGVEGDLQLALRLLPADLGGPVDVLEDEVDGLRAAALHQAALLVRDKRGRRRATGEELQLYTNRIE